MYSRDDEIGGLGIAYLRQVYRVLDRSRCLSSAEFFLIGSSMLGKGPSKIDSFHRLDA